MTPRYKLLFLSLGLSLLIQSPTHAALPQVDNILQHGFSNQPKVLTQSSRALLAEYNQQKNITSLIFYAYSMLRLADYYKASNDFVHASEYAKFGFFYLDEAVDSHENNWRVRYLRARIDAYVAADLGRCVIALDDTAKLLNAEPPLKLDPALLTRINHMRYRALLSCHDKASAAQLLKQMQNTNAAQLKALTFDKNGSPEWDSNEVSQILIPLMKGE